MASDRHLSWLEWLQKYGVSVTELERKLVLEMGRLPRGITSIMEVKAILREGRSAWRAADNDDRPFEIATVRFRFADDDQDSFLQPFR